MPDYYAADLQLIIEVLAKPLCSFSIKKRPILNTIIFLVRSVTVWPASDRGEAGGGL